jgi:hypothetical protein
MGIVIPRRFNGPPSSGNGGYSAGRFALALTLARPVEVTLRRPIPLDVAMRVDVAADVASVFAANELIATAAVVDDAELGDPVAPVPFADAVVAALNYPGKERHPFPTCFVCGPDRADRDGLEVFPGPVGGDRTYVAAALVLRPEHVVSDQPVDAGLARLDPDLAPVAPELVWAALDCPGGWAIDLANRPAVLGRYAARVFDVPAIGEHCVVVGTLDGWDGRKAFTRSTAYGADGRELGRAKATWIEINR